MKKGLSKLLSVIAVFIISMFFLSGCGGGSGTTGTTVASTPSPVPSKEIISTVTETNTKTSNISAAAGGEISLDDLTIDVPSGALPYDNEIEISTVTITDEDGTIQSSINEHGPIYEISSGSPDELIELNKPVNIEMKVPTNSPAPGLAIWDGYEWLIIDEEFISYDSNTHTLTTSIDYIEEDLSEYVIEGNYGSILEQPLNITYFPNINYGYGLNYNYPYHETSSNGHFTIHYSSNMTKNQVTAMGDALEGCYSFYKNLGYASPVNFLYTKNSQTSTSEKIMVYTKQDTTRGAWASRAGIIFMPSVTNYNFRETAYHELFHLVQYNYARRKGFSSWMAENTAESMGPYAYNQLNTTEKTGYDYKNNFWRGSNLFQVSLDSETNQNQYYNGVIWMYLIGKYGINTYRDIAIDFFSGNSRQTLEDCNQSFQKIAGKTLNEFYFEAFEDYFIYGEIYNKSHFLGFPYRESGDPFCNAYSGYSKAYNYNAFNSDENPYYTEQTIKVPHLSGRYFNFKSDTTGGSLYLKVTPSEANNFKVKIYYFKNNGRYFQMIGQYEYTGAVNLKMDYTTITNITVLLENSSFEDDNSVNFQAYGQ